MKLNVDSSETVVLKESDWDTGFVMTWNFRFLGALTCSPDGNRVIVPVAYDLDQVPEGEFILCALYAVDVSTGDVTQITDPAADGAAYGDYWPCWSSR